MTTEGISEMRVLIVVDNALTAEAIRRELRHIPACEVIGFVNGRAPCAMTAADAAPDLVLIDDMSESLATLSRIREVRAAVPAAKIVLLTVRMEDAWLGETLNAGAHAAISKAAPPSIVGLLIRAVAATLERDSAHEGIRRSAAALDGHTWALGLRRVYADQAYGDLSV